ncbi:MAG TPA: hypothetical protein VJ249_11835 [Candidatus Bathyarchaeia archaeon]|nr:hypothetical protein [Candidatus Bathyarchaeia archaeon]
MDRIDKVLLVLPLLPAADLLSTLFSLARGGQEVGILARPMLEQYGSYGLFPLAVSASVIFLAFMYTVIRIKKLFVEKWKLRWTRQILMIPIYWFFILQGVYVSTVIMNFLVPLSPALAQILLLRIALGCMYFVVVSMLTRPQMSRL